MRHQYRASYRNVLLRPLEHKDIEALRIWRNNTEKTRFLRPIGHITPEMQEQWFEKYLQNEQEIAFAIEETQELKRLVGSVSLYDFQGDVAEIGKIQIGDSKANGKGIGRLSLVMAMKVGFEELGLKKIVASVHRDNIASYTNFVRIGCKIIGNHPSVVGGIEDEFEIIESWMNVANGYIPEVVLHKN